MLQRPFTVQQLAFPAVSVLISFLTFTSQYLLTHIEHASLRDHDLLKANIITVCIGICYYRSCTVDPGRIPKDWKPSDHRHLEGIGERQRWCRKCEAFKPPRAHHCRTCGRWVPFSFFLRLTRSWWLIDVYPKWIIIVLGRQIASRIPRFHISFDFCFTQ